VHLRLGDAANGTAFKARTVGTVGMKDVRMSIDDALDVLGNAQYTSPLYGLSFNGQSMLADPTLWEVLGRYSTVL